MKRLTILFIALSNMLCAQESSMKPFYKNEAFLELLGNGGYASINFQRMVYHYNKFSLGISAGISTFKMKDFDRQFNPDLILPISARLFYGGQRHKIFIGLGQTISSTNELNTETFKPKRTYDLSANFMAGYRYDFSKIMLQLAFTPILEKYATYHSWLGFAVGYKF
jgi:hypothetical protein